MGCDPSKVQRCHRPKKVILIHHSQTKSKRKVVNHAHPQFIGDCELLKREPREPSEFKQRRRREYKAPDFLKISNSQLKRVYEPVNIDGARFHRWGTGISEYGDGQRFPDSLPT